MYEAGQRPSFADDLINPGLDTRCLGTEITHDRKMIMSRQAAEKAIKTFAVPAMGDYAPALFSHSYGQRRPDAGRGTGDEDRFTGKFHVKLIRFRAG